MEEEYYQIEVRTISCPDGIPRIVKLRAYSWRHLDSLIASRYITLDEAVSASWNAALSVDEQFEISFRAGLEYYIFSRMRELFPHYQEEAANQNK